MNRLDESGGQRDIAKASDRIAGWDLVSIRDHDDILATQLGETVGYCISLVRLPGAGVAIGGHVVDNKMVDSSQKRTEAISSLAEHQIF